MADLTRRRCKPCEGGVAPYNAQQVEELLRRALDEPASGRDRSQDADGPSDAGTSAPSARHESTNPQTQRGHAEPHERGSAD